MQQIAHKIAAKPTPFSLSLSNSEESPQVIEMTFGTHQKLKIRQQISHTDYTAKMEHSLQDLQNKKDDECLAQDSQIQCQNCAKWRKWSLEQQKMLLLLEKELIIKEQKLQHVMNGYRAQLLEKSHKNQNLQLTLQQKIHEVSTLENSLAAVTKQLECLENQQKVLETPKKQHIKQGNDAPIDLNKVEPIYIKGMQSTDKVNNPTKDSAFTTRAEGWQCPQTMKKKNVEKVLHFGKKSQLQKYVFQNQTLKDYNAVLVQRLKASKYKGIIC